MAFFPGDQDVFSLKANTEADEIESVEVRTTDALNAEVPGVVDVDAMAQDVVDSINAATSSPDYDAKAKGNKVLIIAAVAGTKANGAKIDVTTWGDVVVSDILDMAGGVDASELDPAVSVPGHFVKTFGSKIYVLSGPVTHFSGIGQPTIFTTEAIGAGFIDMSTYASGARDLVCVENYFEQLAFFARDHIQIWSMDPDPAQNQQEQILRNVGTYAPHSIQMVGESDLFFLADNGIRSLRPTGTSLAASIVDVSLPIDDEILEHIDTVGESEAEDAVSVIEPVSGRYWLVIGGSVFVFSRFVNSKISAWSKYEPGFTISDILRMSKQVYARSGSTIFLYGGDSGNEIDDSRVTVRIPYLDGQKPADHKIWRQLNMAAQGTWTITTYTDPENPAEADAPTELIGTTYGKLRYPIQAHSTHLSLLLEHEANEDARLSNLAVHFESGEPE